MNERVEFTISWATLLKIAVACVLAYCAVMLASLAKLLLLAVLVAIALAPLLAWTRRRGWPKWLGLLLCALLLFGFSLVFFGLLIPMVTTEAGQLIANLPRFRDEFFRRLPAGGPIRDSANQFFASPTWSNPEPIAKQVVAWGSAAAHALVNFFLMLIVSLYFLADGRRVSQWLLAFLPAVDRAKASDAFDDIAQVVAHYVLGQIITSVLCGIYAFLVLFFLHVPNAPMLAALAAVLDVLPLIGFFLFTIPAILVAFTVSPTAALIVAICYGGYKVVEDYFIVPYVYGNALKLSTLTVLLSCLAAGAIGGVIGIIIV
ncbi:MAG: AI-2E family transporter, partial [Verrucomicrobiota bacterium]|nr:AI-2E family transporter [Verrucomicrobiota bacterium]